MIQASYVVLLQLLFIISYLDDKDRSRFCLVIIMCTYLLFQVLKTKTGPGAVGDNQGASAY